ncbi:MAG: Uma2 family endonuclease [Aliifodinibius sp.]|nr:Uma2 family endonuclease [candidate division KSB1 bacterium]NIV12984.1 Uma2 family endonuclease [Fodinibius sp.]NIS25058.1 Uma2 family endonuclease [candidate division KSB1 bacterium]NIU25735.1 Uma2 family endonuclease [candidate division KSB1 bacterium]NIV96349.1 Uma2 family endonuclease [candidate division KSB1 bacterium]
MSLAVSRKLFTVDEYHQMAHTGILSEDDRVELLAGEIIEMSPIGSRHAACVAKLTKVLSQRVGDRAIVWVQNPIHLSRHSEPQPDLSLLKPRADFYAQDLPQAKDVHLIIEVAESSADFDRDVKLPLYAQARIAEVWLVILAEERIEVYRSPSGSAYQQTKTYRERATISPQAIPDCHIDLKSVL